MVVPRVAAMPENTSLGAASSLNAGHWENKAPQCPLAIHSG